MIIEIASAPNRNPAMGLFVRTIGIARARTKIGMANLAYNLTRFVWHQGRVAPA
jgi:IS5 family transposase